jgi:glycerate kinase
MPRVKKPQPLHILCAPGAFKECMSAPEAAAAMARGVQRAAKSLGVEITATEHPLSDGGADFVECAQRIHRFSAIVERSTTGPNGAATRSPMLVGIRDDQRFGNAGCLVSVLLIGLAPMVSALKGMRWFVTLSAVIVALGAAVGVMCAFIATGDFIRARRTARIVNRSGRAHFAIFQLSSAAGLALVPKDLRDPTRTTTYGVGELILAALDAGARDITIGVGNSATVDGGAGALAALGVKFFDAQDTLIEHPTGGDLARIARIDASNLDPRLQQSKIIVACDVDNPLAPGIPDGAAQTFAPQKGATPEQVAELERGLANFVEVLRAAGFDPKPDAPHSGAAGGFGFGLATVLAAELVPAVSLLFDEWYWCDYPALHLVLTGEGRLDGQSIRGKLPVALSRVAREGRVPTIALVGSVGEGAERCLDPEHAEKPGGETEGGLLDYLVITPKGMPIDEALRRGPELLEAAAERAVTDWVKRRPAGI